MVYMGSGGATLLVETWKRKNKNKSVEWKVFVDTVGIKCVDLKAEFLLQIFAAFRVAVM